jgi:HPt (histidine-containing phosphotransfer) domain-containing protein
VLNGYEATAEVRAAEGDDRHTPILALTAGAGADERARCLAEGMDGYLAKPLTKALLLALVARFVGTGEAGREPTEPVEPTVDLEVLDELRRIGVRSDQDLLGDLTAVFLEESEPLVVSLRSSFEAGDAADVGRLAHLLRGSSGQLGGRRLSQACGRLEQNAADGGLDDGDGALRDVEVGFGDLCRALACHHDEDRGRPPPTSSRPVSGR